MSKIQTMATQRAIHDNAYKRFEGAVVQSFQMEHVNNTFITYRKIAETLGADPTDCTRHILSVMSSVIRTANNDKRITGSSAEANAFITRIRRVAVGWGMEDTFIDMGFCVNGLTLLEVATSS